MEAYEAYKSLHSIGNNENQKCMESKIHEGI